MLRYVRTVWSGTRHMPGGHARHDLTSTNKWFVSFPTPPTRKFLWTFPFSPQILRLRNVAAPSGVQKTKRFYHWGGVGERSGGQLVAADEKTRCPSVGLRATVGHCAPLPLDRSARPPLSSHTLLSAASPISAPHRTASGLVVAGSSSCCSACFHSFLRRLPLPGLPTSAKCSCPDAPAPPGQHIFCPALSLHARRSCCFY